MKIHITRDGTGFHTYQTDPMSHTTTVYLIHFDQPLGNERHQASHYIGSTSNLKDRLALHTAGSGARIMAAVCERGITFACVRTWRGGRQLERKLKRRKKARQLCPVCRARKAA